MTSINLQEQYIKNSSEFKGYQKNLLKVWNKYQNKFAYRKNQTNKWVSWAYKNPDAFFGGLENEKNKKLLLQVRSCCNYKIDWLKLEEKEAKIRFANAITCKKYKLCSNCARLKANQNIAKFTKFLEDRPPLLQKNWYFMVLTLQHTKEDTLEDLFTKLNSSLDKVRSKIKEAKRGEITTSPFRFIEGALLAIEATHNDKSGWHPHVNILFCTDHTFDLSKKGKTQINEQITEAWLKITGDSFITSIQKVIVKDKLHEVLKYITKFSELSDLNRLELFVKTNRFRFLRKWGLLYGAPINEDEILERTVRQKYEFGIPTKFSNGRYIFSNKHLEQFYNTYKENFEEDVPPDVVDKVYKFFDSLENKDSPPPKEEIIIRQDELPKLNKQDSEYIENWTNRGLGKEFNFLYKIKCPFCSSEIDITNQNKNKPYLVCKGCKELVKVILPNL